MGETRGPNGPKSQADYSDLPQKPIKLKEGIGGLVGPGAKKPEPVSEENVTTKAVKAGPPKHQPSETTQWTIRGISKLAREAATSAAKQEGIKLNEWLERAIHLYLSSHAMPEQQDTQVREALDDIRQRLERIERQSGFLYRIWQRMKTWLG